MSEQKDYVIICENHKMPTPYADLLFWSNTDGWVARSDADVFSKDERMSLNLPIEGRWVENTSYWNCRHCGQQIHLQRPRLVYVDGTGGDVCCADKFTENNENGSHQP